MSILSLKLLNKELTVKKVVISDLSLEFEQTNLKSVDFLLKTPDFTNEQFVVLEIFLSL
jgi:replicative DNA helicase